MANKGQQGKKEAKKPRKDGGSSSKPPTLSDRPVAPMTVVPERSKKK